MDTDCKPQIAVFGSASGDITKEDRQKARIVGETIAKAGCTLFFGGCGGLPYEAALAARKAGGRVVGISPANNWKEHVEKFGHPTKPFDAIIFTGFERNGRNTVMARSVDAGIVIGGSYGTLNEFSAAVQENKPLGVLEGTNGISGIIRSIIMASARPLPTEITFGSDAKALALAIVAKARMAQKGKQA